jgi:putative Holliday junction resolvase
VCILGLDYGDKTIGVAVSDSLKIFAFDLEVIFRKKTCNKNFFGDERLLEIIEKYKIAKIILGFPKNMNNTCGEQCKKTLIFKNHLEELLKDKNISIILWDERLSTVQARKKLFDIGVKLCKQKKVIDKMAATFILQSYLDFLKINCDGGY